MKQQFYYEKEIKDAMKKLGMDHITPIFTTLEDYKSIPNVDLIQLHHAVIIVEVYVETKEVNGKQVIADEKFVERLENEYPIGNYGMLLLESLFMNPYDIYVFVTDNLYGETLQEYFDEGKIEKLPKINNPVYAVYESSDGESDMLTSIFADRKSAEQYIKEYGEKYSLVPVVDTFELEGSIRKWDFDLPIHKDCKYYTPKLEAIRIMISAVYDMDGCACGGIGHVVFDDNNYDDSTLEYVIAECDNDESKDRPERSLVKLICEELLSLSIQQRALIFGSYYASILCEQDCENCNIEEGNYE